MFYRHEQNMDRGSNLSSGLNLGPWSCEAAVVPTLPLHYLNLYLVQFIYTTELHFWFSLFKLSGRQWRHTGDDVSRS